MSQRLAVKKNLILIYLFQIYFCLRSGYYDEAKSVAQSSRVSLQFASQVSIVHLLHLGIF